jgi:ankyrin repeat protein
VGIWVAAVARGDLWEAMRLLDEGADIEARDSYGNTALIVAAQGGHREVLECLLDRGGILSYVTGMAGQPSQQLLSGMSARARGRHRRTGREWRHSPSNSCFQGSGRGARVSARSRGGD